MRVIIRVLGLVAFALTGEIAPLLAEIRNNPVVRRPPEEIRVLSYEYGAARGAIFRGPNPAPCPWTIVGSEAQGDEGVWIEIGCGARPTPAVFVFHMFASTRLNRGWNVRSVEATTRDETNFLGRGMPNLAFVERPLPGSSDPRTVLRVVVPAFTITGVQVRVRVGRARPPASATPVALPEPLFRCDTRIYTIIGPASASYTCRSNGDCAAGFTCGHPICGNVCVGPLTGP